ncbi:transmembrane prolyl 4-hydroxylase-like [Haliotis rubra]|uniref:transmembrane prolyl 4-hydroxylase-like n=1 Tax=Haliotis rubra TaxID=36100 RepID=UPI001EE5BF4A|nr:transmembrane prolyl 4-hydroxylase-like [Haliotis rubra]
MKTLCQTNRGYCLHSGLELPDVGFLNTSAKCALLKPRDYILPRIDPGQVGDVTEMNLTSGQSHRRITVARNPPLFEIPDFLTQDETDKLIGLATANGLDVAMTVGENGSVTHQRGRRSQTTFLRHDLDSLLIDIRRRVSLLTDMPMDLLEESEWYQFGMYGVGDHYHSHYDSSLSTRETLMSKPCCHQSSPPHTKTSCVLCRYMTVMVYLNDVEEGGETAFPLADGSDTTPKEEHINLSQYCQRSALLVQPQKGKAVMWYNNIRDPETGWVGTADPYSLHGGCNVIKGEKWILNFWVSTPQHNRKFGNSIYTERWV